MEQIQKLIEEQGKLFEQFKSENDRRIKEIEKTGSANVLTENKIDKMSTALGDLQKQIDELTKKTNRPYRTPGEEQAETEVAGTHRKAFVDGYMRKGREDGLSDLQVKSLSISVQGDGGYAVPQDLDKAIIAVEANATPMRGICNVITASNESYAKLVSQHGAASGWVGETSARPETGTPSLARVAPSFGEVYANPSVTQKALDDLFFDASSWLAEEVGLAFALSENTAFVSGDGNNKPKGFLSYTLTTGTPTFGQIKQVNSGSSGALVADKIFDVIHTLKAGYRQGAVWQMATLTVAAARKLKDTTNRYLWEPSLQAGVPASLAGYTVIENEDMPAMGAAANAVAFGNFKRGYKIVDLVGTRVLRDPYTNKPYVMFYTTKRLGGGVEDSNAIIVHSLQ